MIHGLLENLDPTRDSGLDILHDFHLGLAKDIGRATIDSLNDEQKVVVAARCDALNWGGFDRPMNGKRVATYLFSFVGKDFGILYQMAPFIFDGLVSKELLKIWIELAFLGKLLERKAWRRTREYCRYLLEQCNQLKRAMFEWKEGEEHLTGAKWHDIIVHAVEMVDHLGPFLFSRVDNFEYGNQNLRADIAATNRNAVSNDIAEFRAMVEGVRALLLGGYFFEAQGKIWRQSGSSVIQIGEHPAVRNCLMAKEVVEHRQTGVILMSLWFLVLTYSPSPERFRKPRLVEKSKKGHHARKRARFSCSQLRIDLDQLRPLLPEGLALELNEDLDCFQVFNHLVLPSKRVAKPGDFVVFEAEHGFQDVSPDMETYLRENESQVLRFDCVCRFHPDIFDTLSAADRAELKDFAFFIGQLLDFQQGSLHPTLGLPVGHLGQNLIGHVDRLCRIANVQHACDGECGIGYRSVRVTEERVQTEVERRLWVHSEANQYVRNWFFKRDYEIG